MKVFLFFANKEFRLCISLKPAESSLNNIKKDNANTFSIEIKKI